MNQKNKMKIITIFTALISLVSFCYKLGLGIYNTSIVLIIASISTLMVFICKLSFIKTVNRTRKMKKKSYLIMTIATTIYAILFLLFVVLKVAGIDTSNNKTYEGWMGALFIAFIFIMFILSIIKLKGALAKTDLIVSGLKEITFVSALMDLVIIENFALRIYLRYQPTNNIIQLVDNYFPLAISIIMLLVSVVMIIRYIKYKPTLIE